MATLGHLAAGAVCGAVYSRASGSKPATTIAAFAVLAGAPDLDLLLTPYTEFTPFAHRILTHSIPFAFAAGALAGYLFRRRPLSALVGVLATLALMSHGLLDALTRSGSGPKLLWPFSSAHFSLAWQPIPGMASYQEYFTLAAAPVYAYELVLSLPLVIATAFIMLLKRDPAERVTFWAASRGSGVEAESQTP